MNNEYKESICQSECLTGKCPFNKCIKYNSQRITPDKKNFEMQILQHSFGIEMSSTACGFGIAFDLGTTTIVGALYDLSNAQQLCVVSGVNRQVAYGRDVITRIKYCVDNTEGLTDLHRCVIDQLNEMITVLCSEGNIEYKNIDKMCVAGNTTMLHLFIGLSPASMGEYPFKPFSLFGIEINTKKLGLKLNADCYLPPCISSFVGADIVCGLTALNFQNKPAASFMDIGTNGEISVVHNNCIYASATAAGPAFEGANISCGMAAAPGAISHIDIEDKELVVQIIDGGEPKGLTGSGLCDAVAAFLKLREVEPSGKIEKDTDHYILKEHEPALKIIDDIFLTQKDIREFQTAKAALCAGIITLNQTSNKEFDTKNLTVEKLFLAGGFGNFLNINNAKLLGLIPKRFKVLSVGNTSLAGAALLMMNEELKRTARQIADSSKVIDLSVDPTFIEKYIECMKLTAL